MKMRSKYLIGGALLLVVLAVGIAAVQQPLNPLSLQTPAAGQWHKVREGLSYADVSLQLDDKISRDFFVVKINPQFFQFRVFENKSVDSAITLKDIHQQEGSVLTFNGAFFDTNFKAMGLLQDSQSRIHSKISSQLMNGIFWINDDVAGISRIGDVVQNDHAFMIQNGPILIYDDQVVLAKDTGKLAARTAIGTSHDGDVVLIVLHQDLLNTENTLSLYQLAHVLKEQEFFKNMGFDNVLNLDGGPSSGVVVDNQYLPELSPVQNAVFALPRGAKI